MKSPIIKVSKTFLPFPHFFCTVLLTLSFVFFLSSATAQVSVNASGGSASSSEGSVDYSIGQVVYTTNIAESGSVAQGIQQPYVILEFEEPNGTKASISAYPNPTTDLLTLDVRKTDLSAFSFRLYDIVGRLLQNEPIITRETNINMSSFLTGIYFIKVFQENNEMKTFKIVKN